MRKVEQIVREEMDRAGAQEILMPAICPAELWQESGRWEQYGKELLRIKDRYERDFCFGPTHEEVVTDIVRREMRSYRELPLNLYQIQVKFRDEMRPRFGLMRGREFIMKDAYSFHADAADCEREYQNMADAYRRIFQRCGLDYPAGRSRTPARSAARRSHEFQVLADSGEDAIVSCTRCDYAANVEKAEIGRRPAPPQPTQPAPLQEGPHARASAPSRRSRVSRASRRERFIKTLLVVTRHRRDRRGTGARRSRAERGEAAQLPRGAVGGDGRRGDGAAGHRRRRRLRRTDRAAACASSPTTRCAA